MDAYDTVTRDPT